MESFLRRKLGGSSLQKPISSFQSNNLPDVCSSFYSIADEPFPQVSGFLDDTVEQSFLSNKTPTALNSPACIPSEKLTKHKNQGDFAARNETTNNSDLNFSLTGACSHLADESTSTKSLQNDKNIICVIVSNDLSNCPSVSTSSLEKSDSLSVELKNSTFNVTQDVKEGSGINTTDTGINAIVDLQISKEKNTTFESVQSQELREASDTRLNSTVDIDVPIIKSGNATIDLVQTSNTKEGPDTDVNATVDIPNLDCTHDKINSDSDNSVPSNTEQPNEKHDGTTDMQAHELEEKKWDGSLNSTRDAKINSPLTKNSAETNVNINVTVEVVEQTDSAALQAPCDVQSSSASVKPAEGTFTKLNTTTELTVPDVPILKNTTIEIKSSSTETTSQAKDGTISVMVNAEMGSNNRETEVEISTPAFVRSVETSSDSPNIQVEECPPKTSLGFADPECIQNSSTANISRNSIFCLDDTLDMKTSFMVTSTPIIFGKESRFEILRDVKPTPMRKRLSVINSIEAHSNDELVGTSHHDGTVTQVTQSSNRSQKVSTHCTSGQSTSEPANENKPPTKPIVKRQLPQLSSKLSYPKSGLPPRPQSSMNSSAAVRPKTVQVQNVPHPPDASSSTLLGNKKSGQLNKVKNVGNVKNTPSAGTVKTPAVPPVSGYTFTAVSKPSSSGIPQMKPSGLQPPTRKRSALKTPQTMRTSVETFQPPSSNRLPGMRTRNSLLPSVGQKHLNNDDLPSAKRKRIAPTVLPAIDSEAVQPVRAHGSDCDNCSHHHEKLERFLEELGRLRSECKNWGPLLEKLEMRVEELKRI